MNDLMPRVRPGSPMMTSQEIAELVEKRHDNVKRTVEMLASREVISLPQIEEVKIQRERREETVTVYLLDKRSSLITVAQLSPEFTARVVDRWQELEAQVPTKTSLPDFTDPAAAAIAWAEQYRARQTAETLAIEHKTRSTELEIQLDQSKDYYTVKRMQKLYYPQLFDWRELKTACNEMDMQPVKVFDQNYGMVNAYHRDVWVAVYGVPTYEDL